MDKPICVSVDTIEIPADLLADVADEAKFRQMTIETLSLVCKFGGMKNCRGMLRALGVAAQLVQARALHEATENQTGN